MAKRDGSFPYWLVVLGFPLLGGLFLGVAIGWSRAIGGGRPPAPLALPVELFLDYVARLPWPSGLVSDVGEIVYYVIAWEVAWLAVGIVVALLAWLFTLLVPGGKGEGR